MPHIGLDAGSVSVKLVIFDRDGNRTLGRYEKHQGRPIEKSLEMLRQLPEDNYTISLTGSAGRLLGGILSTEAINEIVAQAYATSRLHPEIKSIIEMGGEDSKLIVLSNEGVSDFSMNSVCAAGTGSFLDQQGERLRLSPEEMSELALRSKKPPRIAGRCSVFAKSDMIHLQQIATPVEDIVSGLCFAVARNFKGSILKGRQLQGPVSFQGGVAANLGMRRAFREVFGLDDLFVPEDFALMGAIGAGLKALDDGELVGLELAPIEEYLDRAKVFGDTHSPLREDNDDFHDRHIRDSRDVLHPLGDDGPRIDAFMGIDIGSISTNLAVVDSGGRLLAKRYLMTAGRPIEAVRQGLSEIESEVGEKVNIMGVGTTGSGRYMISDYVGADIVKNEITAQATAASFIDPEVDTIFEIGGQDSKFISLREGVIVDFEMNKACAAGTGSFLEEQAEKLNISVKGEFADCAFESGCPSKLGERCTVFMENSLMANLQKGSPKNDLLAGLSYSIVQNYINRVVAGKHIGKRIFFQGGVAFNKSVVAAFEKHVGCQVSVPDNHDVTGAIGMALIAMRYMSESGKERSSFVGFEAARTPYEISTFGCKSCSNMCEINTVKIENRKNKLFYGGRCEKYDINRKDTSHIPDLFKFRTEALWAEVRKPKGNRPVIGVPYVFFMNELLPFFSVLLDELGLDMIVSPKTDRRIVDAGLQSSLSEACFPVKVALGHIKHFREEEVDAVLLPSVINLNPNIKDLPLLTCPHTQALPYVGRVAFDDMNILAPRINLSLGNPALVREIRDTFREFGIGIFKAGRAVRKAWKAQNYFYETIRKRGREAVDSLDRRAVAILGRSYNAFEPGMNLQIPSKLATLDIMSIPQDMLPVEDVKDPVEWPNMYWRSGKNMLKAAEYVRDHKHLYPILIGNFSCGPDSFILKKMPEALGGKPYLHIEIDEHSADAGAITRCEAFLDSIENKRDPVVRPTVKSGNGKMSKRIKKIYMPRMADHAFALAAAFEKAGIEAEVMPVPDKKTAEIGMKHTSGKECYPCIVTTGEMIRTATSEGFDPEHSAFFMPSGTGPCRFGQYNIFHKAVLDSIGPHDIPVIAPNQDDGLYQHLGELDKDFTQNAWLGIIAIELLYKSLRETRPYAIDKNAAQAVYDRNLERVYTILRGANTNGSSNDTIEDALTRAREEFGAINVDRSQQRPLIGVIGEIYVRLNEFSNESLVNKIEDLGGEVWMAPFEEWIYYVNFVGNRKALRKREYSAMLHGLVKNYYQEKIEHRLGHIFEGSLSRLHEARVKEVLRNAAPYVDDSFEGEAVLSVGKAIDMIDKGASGIVNAMPFGCMPSTVVTAIMRAVQRDYGAPWITVPYDGTESSTTVLQLEAFMDQARSRMEKIATSA